MEVAQEELLLQNSELTAAVLALETDRKQAQKHCTKVRSASAC
jgi:hypothetical protein